MKKILLLILLLSNSISLFAQTAAIRGRVADSKTRQAIEYASAAVFKAGDSSSLVAGVISKANGSFEFSKLPAGRYRLKIAFIGYQDYIKTDLQLGSGQRIDLGEIFLQPANRMLNEVNVKGQQLNAVNKIDKQIYRAGQFEAAKGGSAVDVIRNLPSVSVDGQGNITMRGSESFMVLINGKPVITDAQTVLSQMPANAVENIEVVTSPSAKYDPDGRGGILNIITKKGAVDGITLALNAQGGLPSIDDHNNSREPVRFGGDATLNYRKGKWDISAGGNYNRNDNAGYREGDVFTKNFNAGTITRFPSTGERSFKKYNYAGRTTINFTPDAFNSFSGGLFLGQRYQDRIADLVYHNTTSNLNNNALIKSTTYYNSNLQTKEGSFALANFDYTHTFADKSTLVAGMVYEHADLYGNTRNRNLHYPNTADTIQYVYNPYKRPISGYRFKLDHSLPLGKGKLESGYQLRYDTQDGQFDYTVTPPASQPDAGKFQGSLHAKNVINSVYSQYSGKSGKWEYNGGLRYEYATRSVDLSYDPNRHQLDLSNLFPSALLQYSLTDSWKLKADYSKRINRTTNLELNPIPEREHSETLEEGDPDLLPEFIDQVELGINHTFKAGSFFATAYYQHIKNPIQRLNSVYVDTILNRVYTNAGVAKQLGVEVGTNLQLTRWWSLYAGANAFNYHINGNIFILNQPVTVNNQRWAYTFNANTTLQLAKTWSAQVNVNYLSKRPTAQGEDSQYFIPNSSVKKTFMNGRMAASLLWQNMGIFNSAKQRITTSGADFYTTTNYIYETNMLLVNISFNLNRFASKLKLPNSELNDREF
ncbi:outer membrane receptor protein involved in Fe transport [Mucilaginibacter yixingensis]|uniref:Outer membrane receptor protein involved in Fe transport n=1 Tax=Mucilaginibacter yixingensis TaxID=1295612 RepID=A0A2T5J612_9SPHI|nr:TonB-dependent receptor [Mucilaginibacter yixingensis]PTQ93995.1 outer membrane receptor protein involved in Fe transport [Mucilaginibacter yixingensis]